jgi:hypothetical protein
MLSNHLVEIRSDGVEMDKTATLTVTRGEDEMIVCLDYFLRSTLQQVVAGPLRLNFGTST